LNTKATTGRREGGAQLIEFADQHEVDRVSGQSVAGHGEARHALALQDLEVHAHDAWQDHIGRERIGQAHGDNPWQLAIAHPEDDEDDQPDAEHAGCENGQPLQEKRQKSQRSIPAIVREPPLES
jgi:hypothetical protein